MPTKRTRRRGLHFQSISLVPVHQTSPAQRRKAFEPTADAFHPERPADMPCRREAEDGIRPSSGRDRHAGSDITGERPHPPPRTKPLVAMAEVERPVMVVTTVAMRMITQERTGGEEGRGFSKASPLRTVADLLYAPWGCGIRD